MGIDRTNPPDIYTPPDEGHYAQVLGTNRGRQVYVAGMIAKNEDGQIVGLDDMETQLRVVLDNVETALAVEGADLTDVVRRRTFTTDMSWFLDVQGAVYADYWDDTDVPASTLVEVASLADAHQTGIAPGEPDDVEPRFLVEMDVTAVVPE